MVQRIDSPSNNVYDASLLFAQAKNSDRLDALDAKLSHQVIPQDDLKSYGQELDSLRMQIPADAKDQLVSLYGRVATLTVNNQVDSIVEQSFSLRQGSYSPKEVAQRVQNIQKQIQVLWYNHALSTENRRFIGLAVQILHTVSSKQNFPSSKTADVLHHPDIRSLLKEREMLPQKRLLASTIDFQGWDTAELAFDLCEMAHAFYQNKFKEGLKMLNRLTPEQRARLEEHCLATGAESIQSSLTDNFISYQENMIRFIQALIGMANEVAQHEETGFYPSADEIHMMFDEVERIGEEG